MRKFIVVAATLVAALALQPIAAAQDNPRRDEARVVYKVLTDPAVAKQSKRYCRHAPRLGWNWADDTARYGLRKYVQGWKWARSKDIDRVRRLNRIRVRFVYESSGPDHYGYVTVYNKRCYDGYTWYWVTDIY